MQIEYEDHVPIYINRIQYLEQQFSALPSHSESEKKSSICKQIIELSKIGLEKINQNDLLRYFGEKNHDPSLEENKKFIFCLTLILKFNLIFKIKSKLIFFL